MRLVDAAALSACGVKPSDALLVGLSGGVDSVALLHSLRVCQSEGMIRDVYAAHLNHGIRGTAAKEDAAFCSKLCKGWGTTFLLGETDAPGYAGREGLTLEQAARNLRYAFLRQQAVEKKTAFIAVAHHADDQAETLLLHLMRGSGRAGLVGMRRVSGDILRPLLAWRRRDIEMYAAQHMLPYRIDETNALLDAARNRVRHTLLPQMELFNPRVTEAICRLAAHMAEDEDYLAALATDAAKETALNRGHSRSRIAALPGSIRARVLLQLLRENLSGDVCETDVRRLDALLTARTGSCIEFRHGKAAWLENDALVLGTAMQPRYFETPFIPNGETVLLGGRMIAEQASRFEKGENGFSVCVNAGAIPPNAIVRTRRDGDQFFPFGAPGKRLLSDYLIDRKCPRIHRDMPLLCADDEVLWVVGYSVSERLRVGADTEKLISIRYEEDGLHEFDMG